MGHDRDTRQVLIAREQLLSKAFRRDRRVVPNGDIGIAFLSLWRDFLNIGHAIGDWLLFRVAGYGYRPFSSVVAMLTFVLPAAVAYHYAYAAGIMVPNSDIIRPRSTGGGRWAKPSTRPPLSGMIGVTRGIMKPSKALPMRLTYSFP
jgi:hypothetical protein